MLTPLYVGSLQGLSESDLEKLVQNKVDLDNILSKLLHLLDIQQGSTNPEALEDLCAALKSDDQLESASAAWSLADLAMDDNWRLKIGARTGHQSLALLLVPT